MALEQGIEPRRYAFGAAAALAVLEPSVMLGAIAARELLDPIWGPASPAQEEVEAVLAQIETGLSQLRTWHASGCGDLKVLL